MEVQELGAGLWRWTAQHDEWGERVGCVYVETAEGVVLVDPLVPPQEPERFLESLDRDVARAGGAVDVLLTIFWHARSSRELAERYGARVWAPSRARAAAERRAGPVTPFRPGGELPGGFVPFAAARSGEVLLWLPQHRTLLAGDVLVGDEEGGLRLCPESWLGAATHADLRRALRPLLELPVERLLVSHGAPVREPAAALRALV